MTPYLNRSGTSAVEAYETGPDFILIRFRGSKRRPGRTYRYDHTRPGPEVLALLIGLAELGRGLATYIATTRPRYAARS